MSQALQAVRGMSDLLPDRVASWQRLEARVRELFECYGLDEIRTPVVEPTRLFTRSIGGATDIVEKGMYSVVDRNGDDLSLRPEGTAGCARAALQGGLLHHQQQRLWYMGPMFRHERPQRGRYRQFHQIGVEVFGIAGPDVDAEMICLSAHLWERLGVVGLQLEINTLGSPDARAAYRKVLVDYLEDHRASLDEDCRRRLQTNPLRILDSKNPAMAETIAGAPTMDTCLDAQSSEHFERLQVCLKAAGISYQLNRRLVRGLDYYTHTVFEWASSTLGAQGTVCGGGRYDGLVEQLGGKSIPATGFSIGLERLVELMEQAGGPVPRRAPEIYLVALGDAAQLSALVLAQELRRGGRRVVLNGGGGSIKSQMKRADRSEAALALILGDEELAAGSVTVRPLRRDEEQSRVPRGALAAHLAGQLADTAAATTGS